MYTPHSHELTVARDQRSVAVSGRIGPDSAFHAALVAAADATAAETAAELEQRAGEVLDGASSQTARAIRDQLRGTAAALAAAEAEAAEHGQRAEREAELLRFDLSEAAAVAQEASAARGRVLAKRVEALERAYERAAEAAARDQQRAAAAALGAAEQRLRGEAAAAEAELLDPAGPLARLLGLHQALGALEITMRHALAAGRRQRGD